MKSSEEELKGSVEREGRGICGGNMPVLLMDISKALGPDQPHPHSPLPMGPGPQITLQCQGAASSPPGMAPGPP